MDSKQPNKGPMQNILNTVYIKSDEEPVSQELHMSKIGDFLQSHDRSLHESTDIFLVEPKVEPNEYKISLHEVQMVLDHEHEYDVGGEGKEESETEKFENLHTENLPQNSSKVTPQADSPLKAFSCNLCADTFEHLDSLVKHVALHSKNLQCTTCLQVFPSKRSLKIHVRTHKKKHICSTCGKSFSSKRDLYWHRVRLGKQHTKIDEVDEVQENVQQINAKERRLCGLENLNAEDQKYDQCTKETEGGRMRNAVIETRKAQVKSVNVSWRLIFLIIDKVY